MNWRLVETKNLRKILEIYHGVFGDVMSMEEFEYRATGHNTYLYELRYQEQNSAGFVIFRAKDRTAEMWQAGVLPEFRRAGGGTALITGGEKEMTRLGYSLLKVYTFNYWNIMLSMLAKMGYRIMGAKLSRRREDLKIEMVKELKKRRELRYALTNKCNFRCIFCHNEGLGHGKIVHLPDEEVFNILSEAVSLGYTDITFTGGEPLLKKKRLKYLVDHLGTLEAPPDVTMVTNASLLDKDVIDCFARYPGSRKINLSLHATDEETFQQITRIPRPGIFQKVQDNIRRASEAGLSVKMNHVVLQDINHDKIETAIELAHSLGASAVKFLELLVLPDNADDYSMYYELDAITKQIEKVAGNPKKLNPRQMVYQYNNHPGFKIELQQCTCAVGCSQCREVRDKTFSSDMRYHPCFIRSKKSYKISHPGELDTVLKKGDRIINGYAVKYKNLSPTLIQKDQIVPGKKEFFFQLDNFEEFKGFLAQMKFKAVGKRGFHLEYYWPADGSESWKKFRHVLKFGWDHHNRSTVDMILTDHEYITHPGIGLETVTTYLDKSGPLKFENSETAKRFLGKMNFDRYMECEWEIETWQRNEMDINLSLSDTHSTAKIQGTMEDIVDWLDIFRQYEGRVTPLEEPLEGFMLKQLNGTTVQ